MTVETAIPMVMGSNIGTCMTSTLVSLTYMRQIDEYQRAFTGATMHDLFNWCAVFVLMVLETTTGFLIPLTNAILHLQPTTNVTTEDEKFTNYLEKITKPFTNLVIQVLVDCKDACYLRCHYLLK